MAIENVQYSSGDSHENADRTITTVINGDVEGFSPEQVRLIHVHKESNLGGHWRDYPEIYGIIGQAPVTLEDIYSKIRQEYNFKTGDRLFVPARVALAMQSMEGTTIVTCGPKADREKQTYKCEIK